MTLCRLTSLLIFTSSTAALFDRERKNCPTIWKKAKMVNIEIVSFNQERSGKLLRARMRSGMPTKISNDCMKKLLFRYAFIVTPMIRQPELSYPA